MNLKDTAEKSAGCRLCPRECGADRAAARGRCGVGSTLKVARAALHYWEEPCISGEEGSGTVFFCGCSLGCVYCQNREISSGEAGKEISIERLGRIFLELQAKGANNINLVTAGHYLPQAAAALRLAAGQGLAIPVVYNSGGYESARELRRLEGLVDIYLPDFKYMDSAAAGRYSNAPDYPEAAKKALAEMVRQQGRPRFDGRGMMTAGVIVRHLMLPGMLEDSKAVIRYLYETYGDAIYISIMNQYTPMPGIGEKYPELSRALTQEEYDEAVDFALELGVENGFIQEGGTVSESFIPPFDAEGVEENT